MRHAERGTVLLEAIVALTILATAGVAAVSLLAAGARSERVAASRERTLRQADRLLTVYTLLTRTELDQRLGSQTIGRLAVQVQRPERALYRIAVVDTLAPTQELLVTVVYRPEVP